MDLHSQVAALFGAEVAFDVSPLIGDLRDLFPGEQEAVATAVDARVRSFATGRVCARRLLARFGVHGASIPAAADGRPVWPRGFVGSISHAAGLCVVAVARQERVASLGVDVEIDRSLEEGAWGLVCTPAEMEWIGSQAAACRGHFATALFSAKEAVYKCTTPWNATTFEPRRIGIEWDGVSPWFRACVGDGAMPSPLAGRIARIQGWIFATVQLPSATAEGRRYDVSGRAYSTSRRLAPTSAGSNASNNSGTLR